jgi:hypothetical protein
LAQGVDNEAEEAGRCQSLKQVKKGVSPMLCHFRIFQTNVVIWQAARKIGLIVKNK